MKTNATLHTDGKGLWSNEKRAVKVHRCEVAYLDDEDKPTSGELRVYFTKATWDTEKHGLIYTDGRFMTELKVYLRTLGLVCGVDYSEQGMQGRDYVSCDVGKGFLDSWFAVQAKRRS